MRSHLDIPEDDQLDGAQAHSSYLAGATMGHSFIPPIRVEGFYGQHHASVHQLLREYELLRNLLETFVREQAQQLGLKLESAQGPLPVLIIDHVEPPGPD